MARSLLALGTAGTLIANRTDTLFRPAVGVTSYPFCSGLSGASPFCLVHQGQLELVRWLAVVVLLVVASGWRPRLTALPHWWISFGLHSSAITVDGGDQVTAVLALLLLPVALSDGRQWHWQRIERHCISRNSEGSRLVALSALLLIRLQVAGIYFHAAVAKLRVQEWTEGTALYYWLSHPTFGAPQPLDGLLMPILVHPLGVTLLTWGVILLEIVLFMGLVMQKRAWCVLLAMGLIFHGLITVLQGLPSFGVAMAAALILYLRPIEREFHSVLSLDAWQKRASASRLAGGFPGS